MAKDVKDVARDLSSVVRDTVPRLGAISEAESFKTRGPGTWSRKQILGHLIDSAVNPAVRAGGGGQAGR
jgi:hypothetical protein